MINKTSLTLILILAIGFSESSKFSYEGYSLLKLTPKSTLHLQLIKEWQNNPEFDLWNSIKDIDVSVNVLLSSKALENFKNLFAAVKLPFEIIDENIQNKIEEQLRSSRSIESRNVVGRFARFSEIQQFIDDIVLENPSIASKYIPGNTYEKRNLTVLVLKTPSSKRSIWIDCGIHAREWISPATCVWMMNNLVNEYNSGDQKTVDLLNHFEIHIMPVLNPDGYEYTHTSFRLWRKNRRPNPGSSCVGTDLNRNSGYQWMTGGSSSNVCSDIYAGPSANSELEIQAMQRALNAKLGNWDAYLTLHTFGQWIFTPWGWTSALPSDYSDLIEKANIAYNAIKKQTPGAKWELGSSTNILSVGSGGSEDWAKGVAKIKYSYCFELRPSQSGTDSYYGFTLPADRIPLAGEETYQGIKAMLLSIKSD